MKHSIQFPSYNEATEEEFVFKITGSLVPYVRAVFHSDPDKSSPPEGGYFEDLIFELIEHNSYDVDGNELPVSDSVNDKKAIEIEFENKMFSDMKLFDKIQQAMMDDFGGEED